MPATRSGASRSPRAPGSRRCGRSRGPPRRRAPGRCAAGAAAAAWRRRRGGGGGAGAEPAPAAGRCRSRPGRGAPAQPARPRRRPDAGRLGPARHRVRRRRLAPAMVHIPHRDTDPTNLWFATGRPVAYSRRLRRGAKLARAALGSHSGLAPEPEPRRADRLTHVPLHRIRPPLRAPARGAVPRPAASATSPASCPTTISGRCACRTAGTSSAMRRCCASPCPTAS